MSSKNIFILSEILSEQFYFIQMLEKKQVIFFKIQVDQAIFFIVYRAESVELPQFVKS